MQLVGRAAQPPDYMPSGTVISYGVSNLANAVALAESRGAAILQDMTDDCAGFCFCYLRFPVGLPFGLFRNN